MRPELTRAPRTRRRTHAQQRRFGRRAPAVVQTGVRHVHAGQLADERLILEHRLQIALTHFGLIRRVRRVEFAARRQGIDDGGYGPVIYCASSDGLCRTFQGAAYPMTGPTPYVVVSRINGRVVAEGTPREVVTAEHVQRVYGTRVTVIDDGTIMVHNNANPNFTRAPNA